VTEADPASVDVCYLTTTGRHSGRPHEIEIWFAISGGTVYLLSGDRDRADWVKNILVSSAVTLRIGDRKRLTKARVVKDPDEDALARRLVVEKYEARGEGDLSTWGRTSLVVAVDWRDG
jgi:deazaflavin-dependent oxidoreductase (nitroreductase family)